MNLSYKKIKTSMFGAVRGFPMFFARHAALIFIIGAVISLTAGTWFFYKNAYLLTLEEYDVFVRSRRINTQLLDDTILYIEEERGVGSISVTRDPFRP